MNKILTKDSADHFIRGVLKYYMYFDVFRLLNYACSTDIRLPNADKLLHNEILWLKKLRVSEVNSDIINENFYYSFLF